MTESLTKLAINTVDGLDYCEINYALSYKDEGVQSPVANSSSQFSDQIDFLSVNYSSGDLIDGDDRTISLTILKPNDVDGKTLTFRFQANY